MSSQHVTVDEQVVKQEKQSQSQKVCQENNNTEVEKVISQKLSQLSSQDTNVGTDEEYDPELPGYSDADDENDEAEEGKPCDLCEQEDSRFEEFRSEMKKLTKRGADADSVAVTDSVNASKKKFYLAVKPEKEEAAAANLPSIAEKSTEDPEWLTEQVAVLKEKRVKKEASEELRSWYENRFRTKSVELVDSEDSESQEEEEKYRDAEKKRYFIDYNL